MVCLGVVKGLAPLATRLRRLVLRTKEGEGRQVCCQPTRFRTSDLPAVDFRQKGDSGLHAASSARTIRRSRVARGANPLILIGNGDVLTVADGFTVGLHFNLICARSAAIPASVPRAELSLSGSVPDARPSDETTAVCNSFRSHDMCLCSFPPGCSRKKRGYFVHIIHHTIPSRPLVRPQQRRQVPRSSYLSPASPPSRPHPLPQRNNSESG
jgi:hypothetical protein